MKSYSTVLVLCPHPDDFDVAAVTLKQLHQAGSDIRVAIAPTFSGILDSFYDVPTSNLEKIKTRNQEQRNSIKFFGLDDSKVEFFPNDCDLDGNGEWKYSESNRALVGEYLLKHSPDAIFIPHPNDANPAHSAMYKILSECLTKTPLTVDIFKQMDPKTVSLKIDQFVEITPKDAEWKTALFNHHKTQDHRNKTTRGISLAERILASNKAIAETHNLSCAMAEAFEIEQRKRL